MNNELYFGDTIELMKTIKSESIDMVFSDPPYGMNYLSNHRKDKFQKIENDGLINLKNLMIDYINESCRILKPNSSILLFCNQHSVDLFKFLLDSKTELTRKNLLVWTKNNWSGGDLEGSFAHKHELIWFYTKGKIKINGARTPDIISFDRIPPTLHPTEKPTDLLEFYIRKLTNPNNIIFDGFMGSGATAIASIHSSRFFIGAEMNEVYFKYAQKRINDELKKFEDLGIINETDEQFFDKHDSVSMMTDDQIRKKRKEKNPTTFDDIF